MTAPTASSRAYSAEQYEVDTVRLPLRRSWLAAFVAAWLALLLGASLAAGIVRLAANDVRAQRPTMVAPTASAPAAPVMPPPSVMPPPEPAAVAVAPLSDDQKFLAMLRRDGLHPEQMVDPIGSGVQICRMVIAGDSPAKVAVGLNEPPVTLSQHEIDDVVADAMAAYCPHAGLPQAGA